MRKMDDSGTLDITRPQSSAEAFERALESVKRTSFLWVKRAVVVGGLGLAPLPLVSACISEQAPDEQGLPVFADDTKADWASDEGTRDPAMVSYLNSSWHEYVNCNYRGGCMGVDVFLKLMVRPVEGANLDQKRVGVVYHAPGYQEQTAVGTYFTTLENGYEEWHVPLHLRAYDPSFVLFNCWYQDGRGNTYYDDNNGEYHVVNYANSYQVVAQIFGQTGTSDQETTVHLTNQGVAGRIYLSVADLDYDKDIRLVWTTDGWATVNEFGIGTPGDQNAWNWVADSWMGHETWFIDLDIDGSFERFEYAIVYRHGVVNDAQPYEFWDNNGGRNYVITRS